MEALLKMPMHVAGGVYRCQVRGHGNVWHVTSHQGPGIRRRKKW